MVVETGPGEAPHFLFVRVASILILAIYDVLRGPRCRIVELETKLAPRAPAKFAAHGTPIVMLCFAACDQVETKRLPYHHRPPLLFSRAGVASVVSMPNTHAAHRESDKVCVCCWGGLGLPGLGSPLGV
jgi:hypothetical protein